MPSRIPDLPGDAITPDHTQYLRQCVADMCQIKNLRYFISVRSLHAYCAFYSVGGVFVRFPGSQPVSFASRDLDRLENEEYVGISCFKKRVLALMHCLLSAATGFAKNRMA